MTTKRSISSLTGATPCQGEKPKYCHDSIESASAKKLSLATIASWSAVEERVLVEYAMDKEFNASWLHTKYCPYKL